jgi:hypothetical protein
VVLRKVVEDKKGKEHERKGKESTKKRKCGRVLSVMSLIEMM